ncbi:Mov34/MPN/PAD-1 family protein [Parasphingorhabdus sp.]|uniref:Mov34/MPN/PAD-1 family protein n=1 Tax=Parasphingorhabdus sp. TaxID=2709688 RepID=UPI003D29E8BD
MTSDVAQLSSPLARAVAEYLTNFIDPPFAELTDIEIRDKLDVLHINLEPELPQHREVPFQTHEPVTILFDHVDKFEPRVFSARSDFPADLELIHTNYDIEEDGIALCLWEEAWDNLSRTLTGQAFVEKMRDWFTRTANGDVHPDDQGLEPLLPGTVNTLVLPAGMPKGPWYVVGGSEIEGRHTLVLDNVTPKDRPSAISFSLFSLELDAVVHGALRMPPHNLRGLVDLLANFGADLLASLKEWLLEQEQLSNTSNDRPLLLFKIPMRRNLEGPVEHYEMWAFSPIESIAEFGNYLGVTITEVVAGKSITAAAVGQKPQDLSTLMIMRWRVVQQLDRALARKYAANNRDSDAQLVAIGAGAIGSNLIVNTSKAGIGRWTIIDSDVVLPHNTVRQVQGHTFVGYPKAEVLRLEVGTILAEDDAAAICTNVLHPGEKLAEVDKALSAADIVIDLSASPAVVGYLADHPDVRRAASFFFNPDGSDLVVLSEGSDRALRVDEIEAQYFLACGANPVFDQHFAAARADRLRYANACQDLTRPLPPWQVQTLSGIAAGRLLDLLDDTDSTAQVWNLDPPSGHIVPLRINLAPVQRIESAAMRITVSNDVVATMRALREERAPDETGGILVGSFDLSRNILHILAALPAPSDSKQSPTFFIRGARNLRPLMDMLADKSAGQLYYVGEWHSHPDGVAARPSKDDEEVFSHLESNIGPGGSPFAMLICGAEESWVRVGWQQRSTTEGVISYGDQ